jgi:hypothetical protein
MWCYILHSQKIHSSNFQGFCEGVIYLQFLRNDLSDLLENVWLHTQFHDDGEFPVSAAEWKCISIIALQDDESAIVFREIGHPDLQTSTPYIFIYVGT